MPTDSVPDSGAELEVLIGSLSQARHHLAGTCRELTADQFDTSPLPSGWTLRQRVEHMIINERFWLQAIVGGDATLVAELEAEPFDTWQFDPAQPPAELVALYLAECERSNQALRRVTPQTAVAWFPEEQFGGWRIDTVREVVQHLLIETATHAGHMDVVRELIDGSQWLVLE